MSDAKTKHCHICHHEHEVVNIGDKDNPVEVVGCPAMHRDDLVYGKDYPLRVDPSKIKQDCEVCR